MITIPEILNDFANGDRVSYEAYIAYVRVANLHQEHVIADQDMAFFLVALEHLVHILAKKFGKIK